jgi:CheY-like chemotaxis protein
VLNGLLAIAVGIPLGVVPPVLVVEDAEPLRRVICEALSASGCKVLSAPDGQEALRIVSTEASVDMLLTDVIVSGCAFFRSQRRHKAISATMPPAHLRAANLLETRVWRGL